MFGSTLETDFSYQVRQRHRWIRKSLDQLVRQPTIGVRSAAEAERKPKPFVLAEWRRESGEVAVFFRDADGMKGRGGVDHTKYAAPA